MWARRIVPKETKVFDLLKPSGSIEDCGLSLRWDSAALNHEVERRAAIFSQIRIGRGSTIAIVMDGGFHLLQIYFPAGRLDQQWPVSTAR
jgi:hypothetical protein